MASIQGPQVYQPMINVFLTSLNKVIIIIIIITSAEQKTIFQYKQPIKF